MEDLNVAMNARLCVPISHEAQQCSQPEINGALAQLTTPSATGETHPLPLNCQSPHI